MSRRRSVFRRFGQKIIAFLVRELPQEAQKEDLLVPLQAERLHEGVFIVYLLFGTLGAVVPTMLESVRGS